MGWFDSQIRERISNNNQQLQKAYWHLASVVMKTGKETFADTQKAQNQGALTQICRYFHIEVLPVPDNIVNLDEQMEYLFRPSGIMRRRIKLTGAWWKDCYGPILAEKKDGQVVALLQGAGDHYYYQNVEGGVKNRIDAVSAKEFCEEAVCFYRPLPQKELTQKDLFIFLMQSITRQDKVYMRISALAIMLLGLIVPKATTFLLENILPSGQSVMVLSIGVLLVGTAISKFLFSIVKEMMRGRVEQKMKVELQSAVFARILNLPVKFFKDYSAGELSERVIALSSVCTIFCEILLGSGMTALFSLGYLIQIVSIAPVMFLPSLVILAVQLLIAGIGVYGRLTVTTMKLESSTKVQGIVYEIYSGIQKIKLVGCEERAFAKWAEKYQAEAGANYNPPFAFKIQNALSPVITILGTILLYAVAASHSLSASQYVAFNTSYGMVSGAILSLTSVATMISALRPVMNLADPILKAKPEVSEEKEIVKRIKGNIELNNVSFRYTEDGPWIIDNLNLKIRSGQYVAIVGTTGCGKSTLMRLMMGFETPKSGAVYYDGKDIQKLDQKSLRQQIGVVMQNGKLFSGDIFSNITISAPQLGLKEAWEAAEMAGVADDIRNMPMGMNTILSEGSGGISGGQKQRLMIARAIVSKPKVLMFDEATSALDNITQKQVSDSLNSMKSTRIVIAHRLSTIKECDRIIVLDKGHIIEDGTYESLSKAGGFFSELVARQKIDSE